MLRSLSITILMLSFANIATAEPTELKFNSSLHYVLMGLARSFDSPRELNEKDYAFGLCGVSFFPFTVDDGRMLLFGSTYSYAARIPEDDNTFSMSFTPIAVRIWRQAYFGINFGTMEPLVDDPSHRWTVGVQISLCLAGCSR